MSHYLAGTTPTSQISPFHPFIDKRWCRSPSPERFISHETHPSSRTLYNGKLPSLSTPSPTRRQRRENSPSSSSEIDCEPDVLGYGDDVHTPVLRDFTPGRDHSYGEIINWRSSPFKDERWKLGPGPGEEDRDGGIPSNESGSESDDDDESCGPVTPGTGVRPKFKKAGSYAWEKSPFRDHRWMSEPVDGEFQWNAGHIDDRSVRSMTLLGDRAEVRKDIFEIPDIEEGYEGVRVDVERRRSIRSTTPVVPRKKDHGLARRESLFSTSGSDSDDEQNRFWLGTRYRSPKPRHDVRLSSPQVDIDPYDDLGYVGHFQPSRSATPCPQIPPAHDLPSGLTLHLATHLSTRHGHTRMLDSARHLIEEEGMSGLSMFLYCPKKHVREVWGELKVQAISTSLDQLDDICPGFRERVFVHAHETVNLACPPPGPYSSPSDDEVYGDTIEGLSNEISTLESLGLRYLVVHPGSSSRCGGDGDDPDTIQIIAENIDILLERHPSIIIVLESMTCSNSRLSGTTLPSLAQIRDQSLYRDRIKFCLDLSHVHSMSHDLSTTLGRQIFFDDVDEYLGAENVVCAHVSECGVPHGSGRDVHADFGSGYIGDSAFRAIMTHPSFSHITWIIETPRYLPHTLTSNNIEKLEIDRQALDIAHLRYLATASDRKWMDRAGRGKVLQEREEAIKGLRGKMWAEVDREKKGQGEEKRKRERKRRARLGLARARARARGRGIAVGGDTPGDEESEIRRSPKRDREAILARMKREVLARERRQQKL